MNYSKNLGDQNLIRGATQNMKLTMQETLQQAIEAHKKGKLQDAEASYRAILQVQPMHPDANHNLGVLAVSLNMIEAALPLFKIALEANPNQGQFWLSYVDALIKKKQFDKARELLDQGKKRGLAGEKVEALEVQLTINLPAQDPKKSVINRKLSFTLNQKKGSQKKVKKKNSTLNKSNLSLIQNPSQVELNELQKQFQTGRYDLAEKSAKDIVTKYPEHQLSWKVLGAIYKQIGNLDKSLTANLRAVQLRPDDADIHYNLGITLQALGRLQEAESSYRKAIALNSSFAESHYNLGISLQDLGRLQEAESSYRKAIEINPTFSEAHSNLGSALQKLGRLQEAETSFRQAIVVNTNFAQAHFNLGVTLQELGRLHDAEISYRKAIEINPAFSEAHSNLGNTLQELGRLQESELSYKKAIAINTNFAEAHSNLGNTLRELERLQEAEISYRKAIEINPAFSEAHSNLGNTLKELGRLQEAESSFRRAIELQANLQSANASLGKLLIEKNQHEDGLKMIKRACGYICFDMINGLSIR